MGGLLLGVTTVLLSLQLEDRPQLLLHLLAGRVGGCLVVAEVRIGLTQGSL